jgi:hypothetical protein
MVLRSLAKHPLKLLSFFQHFLGFAAQRERVFAEEIYQRADGDQTILSSKPLRRLQSLCSFGISCPFFKQERHGVFIRRKEVEDRAHAEAMCQFLQRIFVSGQCTAIHKDVVSRVFTFNDDVHGRSHASSVLQRL